MLKDAWRDERETGPANYRLTDRLRERDRPGQTENNTHTHTRQNYSPTEMGFWGADADTDIRE